MLLLFRLSRVFGGLRRRPISDHPQTQHRILIVEDEQDLAEPFQAALSDKDRDVRATTDPQEAIRLLDLFRPDLMITDIVMSGVDILDLIAELRQTHPQLKIIAISGNRHLLRLAAEQGAHHVMPKPFRMGELNALVKKLLGRISN